jgi:hypothetical protein
MRAQALQDQLINQQIVIIIINRIINLLPVMVERIIYIKIHLQLNLDKQQQQQETNLQEAIGNHLLDKPTV